MSESRSDPEDAKNSHTDVSGSGIDSNEEQIELTQSMEKAHIVTERHMVDLTGGSCTCIEDYLFDGPCRHRRKVAKKVTESMSEASE